MGAGGLGFKGRGKRVACVTYGLYNNWMTVYSIKREIVSLKNKSVR